VKRWERRACGSFGSSLWRVSCLPVWVAPGADAFIRITANPDEADTA